MLNTLDRNSQRTDRPLQPPAQTPTEFANCNLQLARQLASAAGQPYGRLYPSDPGKEVADDSPTSSLHETIARTHLYLSRAVETLEEIHKLL